MGYIPSTLSVKGLIQIAKVTSVNKSEVKKQSNHKKLFGNVIFALGFDFFTRMIFSDKNLVQISLNVV